MPLPWVASGLLFRTVLHAALLLLLLCAVVPVAKQRRFPRVERRHAAEVVVGQLVGDWPPTRCGSWTESAPRSRCERGLHPEFFDVFLCHAWDDRRGAAKQLCDLLKAKGVTVWFSEENIGLGVPFMRAIDKGLAKSRGGIVLVTPALLKRLPTRGVADKELSALLARDLLIPIVHETTYAALREESPLLSIAERTGHCGGFDGGHRNRDLRVGQRDRTGGRLRLWWVVEFPDRSRSLPEASNAGG